MQKTSSKTAISFRILVVIFCVSILTSACYSQERRWKNEWKKTDFSKKSIDFSSILDGGPAKDGIPSIDKPSFTSIDKVQNISPRAPTLSIEINGEAKSYPLSILIWHEIVNDVVGGVPVAVSYCPLCNAGIVFDRRLDGQTLSFGTTGKLRYSDLVMYDRESESWWQQFSGKAIVGKYTGKELKRYPARFESLALFKKRHPKGKLLLPPTASYRDYGRIPYVRYDSRDTPYFPVNAKNLPQDVPLLAYIVVIGKQAWLLSELREKQTVTINKTLRLRWQEGVASALDTSNISDGREIGAVVAQRKNKAGHWQDTPYDLTFAFVFFSFYQDGKLNRL